MFAFLCELLFLLNMASAIRGRILFHHNYMAKIISGNEAKIGQFPWEVEISCKRKCTGSLISTEFVLTSAHCIKDSKKCNLTMGHVSEFPDKSGNSDENVEYISVKQIYPHPQFQKDLEKDAFDERNRFDIGLIKLPTPAVLSDRLRPVKFVSKNKSSLWENENVTVVGWGKTKSSNFKQKKTLSFAQMVTLSSQACLMYYPQFFRFQDMVICAVGKMQMVYLGDSGGPLLVKEGDTFVQIGITSYKVANGNSTIPQLFIKIAPHMPWIKYVMRGMMEAENETIIPVNVSSYMKNIEPEIVVRNHKTSLSGRLRHDFRLFLLYVGGLFVLIFWKQLFHEGQ